MKSPYFTFNYLPRPSWKEQLMPLAITAVVGGFAALYVYFH
jgi:hypothetical protein